MSSVVTLPEPTGVKSRPTYGGLVPDPAARRHLLVATPEGLSAVEPLLKALAQRDATVELLWLGTPPEPLPGRVPVQVFPTLEALNKALAERLRTAGMGLRLYLAGPESFIWQVSAAARSTGLREDEIQREACGTPTRRVFCVHCRHIAEGVATNPATCPACGLLLEVRDHFSRAHAAYIGVCVNAEDPGETPEPQELTG